MDREKAIQILKRCEAESHCEHYKRHYCCLGCGQREALDLAIKALNEPVIVRCKDCRWNETCCRNIRPEGRRQNDYCSYGEKQVTGKLKNTCDSLLKADSDECKEQKSKLDCISREEILEHAYVRDGVMSVSVDTIKLAPSVTPTERVTETMIVDGMEIEIDPVSYEVGYTHGQFSERPKGEWIKSNEHKYECPFCHVDFGSFGLKMNYCPNCGAKMKG